MIRDINGILGKSKYQTLRNIVRPTNETCMFIGLALLRHQAQPIRMQVHDHDDFHEGEASSPFLP